MTDLYARLFAACHAVVNDTEEEHPFSGALEAVLKAHGPQDPPTLGGVCASCGGTGLIHGPGQNGNWTDEPCGCGAKHCEECGQIEPCGTKRAIASALGLTEGDRHD